MSSLEDIKLYAFHHHHYIDIPEDHEKYTTSMIDYPNELFDEVRGHELYDRHLRTLIRADQLELPFLVLHPGAHHLFGTDDLGRDVVSRMIHGARVSLLIGIVATTVAVIA